jgi:hypothetical protein
MSLSYADLNSTLSGKHHSDGHGTAVSSDLESMPFQFSCPHANQKAARFISRTNEHVSSKPDY